MMGIVVKSQWLFNSVGVFNVITSSTKSELTYSVVAMTRPLMFATHGYNGVGAHLFCESFRAQFKPSTLPILDDEDLVSPIAQIEHVLSYMGSPARVIIKKSGMH